MPRPAGRSSMEEVRQHLLACAVDESGRCPQYVAIMRGPDGLPKLLTRPALDALCERLEGAAEAGEASGRAEDAPCVLQVSWGLLQPGWIGKGKALMRSVHCQQECSHLPACSHVA